MSKSTIKIAPNTTEQDVVQHIETWLLEWTSTNFGLERDRVGPDTVFTELGLDSVDGVFMISELETMLNLSLSPSILLDCPTTRTLTQQLARMWVTRAG